MPDPSPGLVPDLSPDIAPGPAKGRIIVVQGTEDPYVIPHFRGIAAQCDVRVANTLAELQQALPGAEILLGWDFKADLLEAGWTHARQLRWIHWSGAGVDAVLFPALAASQVMLTNAKGIFDRAMAEYVLACVLALAKRLPETVRLQANLQWRHRLSERIDGRQALVVGIGSIGRSIARLLRAVGMRVEGVGRAARGADAELTRVYGVDNLAEALPRADFVILAMPATRDTAGLFDAAMLKKMRPGARLINVGRGAAVDERALIDALNSGHLAGAGLDVFATEPLPPSSPLWQMENVLVSPHMSGDFEDYAEDLGWLFAQNFERYERDEVLLNQVNKQRGY